MTSRTLFLPLPRSITRRARILLRVILLCAWGALWIAIADRITFPTITTTFDAARPRALRNTITAPTPVTDGATFTAAAIGTFRFADVILDLTPTAHVPQSITAFIGHREARRATTRAPLSQPPHSGLLFAWRNGVWVIDGDRYRPIADAATLRAKGWRFADVQTTVPRATIAHARRGPLFTIRDPLPPGTYLRDERTQTLYRLGATHLHIVAARTDGAAVVSINRTAATTPHRAPCRRSILHSTRVTCRVTLPVTTHGPDLTVIVPAIAPSDLRLITVRFVSRRSRAVAAATVAKLRARLHEKLAL